MDRIRLRGYVGIPLIGRTTTWTRVGAETGSAEASDDEARDGRAAAGRRDAQVG
jgi:hypothetical protein